MVKCKICDGLTEKIFQKKVLNKHIVSYHKCNTCGFCQTDEPYWLPEAYENVITNLDIGLINRNIELKKVVTRILDGFFPESKIMLDYGGGYGMFVRMMRDVGYNFFRQDVYCENLFAKHFDIEDIDTIKFDVLTAFEVFEHLPNPLEEIEKMFAISDTIIFSTVLSPTQKSELESWWYLSPLTGQHVAFYSMKSLEFIAKKFGKKLYSNKINLHVLTDKEIDISTIQKVFTTPKQTFFQKLKSKLGLTEKNKSSRDSLLQKDYHFIESKLLGIS